MQAPPIEDFTIFHQELHKIFSQGPLQDHKKHLLENSQENAAPQMDPETATQTLCEPAQSKCTWTRHRSHFTPEFTGKIPQTRYTSQKPFYARIYKVKCRRPRQRPTLRASLRTRNACHKSHLMREFTRKMPHPKWIPRPRPTLCASLRNRNAHGHVTGAILCENLEENAAPQMDPQTTTHTSRKPAQSKCTWTCHRSRLIQEFTGKMPRPRWISRPRPTLCASLRSRNAHVTGGAILLCEKITGKMLRPRWIPRPRPTLRASLRNAHGHVAGAILCENLQGQGKCLAPNGSPDRDPHFARACAVEMHMGKTQARLCRKKVGSQIQHPDQAPAFTLTVKTPQCGDTAWGTLKETSNKYF